MSNQAQAKAAKIPLTVWVLGFASLLTDVSTELIHAILPNFMTSVLHASFIDVGLIEGLAETLASILKVFSGAWSDRIGKRKGLLLLGYGLSALVKPLYLFANSIVIVLVARLADRVGKGLRGAPRDALVADVTSAENRGRAYGLRQSLDTCGAVLGPLLALLLMWFSQSNYQLAFAVALIPAFAVVLLLYFGVKEPVRKTQTSAAKLFDAKLLAELKAKMPAQFFYLIATVFLFSLANSSDAFLLLKARDCGLPLVACPLVLVAINISYALCAYPAGILSDKVGHGRLLTIAFFLYAVTYLGFAFVTQQSLMLLLCVVYGLYLGLSQGVLSALVSQLTPEHLRGTAFGIVNFAVGLALLPASLLTGFLYQHFGAFVAFATCALIAFLAALILALQLPGLRQAQAALVSD
jgi:MFS family permease